MTGRPAEAGKVAQAVAGMPAPQALRFLAEVLRPGRSPGKCAAIAALMDALAETLDAEQEVIRTGLPVDSADDERVEIREYALRSVHPGGTLLFVTYGDRLFSAVRDASRVPSAEIMHRDVTVGPWVSDTFFTDEGPVRVRDDPPV